MGKSDCLLSTPEIKELHTNFKEDTEEGVKAIIKSFQDTYHEGDRTKFPSISEYRKTRYELRKASNKLLYLKTGVSTIISSGEGGIAAGSLELGNSLGLMTGGTTFVNTKSENITKTRTKYNIAEKKDSPTPIRDTERANFLNSDATIIFSKKNKTLQSIIDNDDTNKPYLLNPTKESLEEFFKKNPDIKILNITGDINNNSEGSVENLELLKNALSDKAELEEINKELTRTSQALFKANEALLNELGSVDYLYENTLSGLASIKKGDRKGSNKNNDSFYTSLISLVKDLSKIATVDPSDMTVPEDLQKTLKDKLNKLEEAYLDLDIETLSNLSTRTLTPTEAKNLFIYKLRANKLAREILTTNYKKNFDTQDLGTTGKSLIDTQDKAHRIVSISQKKKIVFGEINNSEKSFDTIETSEITPITVQANPHTIFVFTDNLQAAVATDRANIKNPLIKNSVPNTDKEKLDLKGNKDNKQGYYRTSSTGETNQNAVGIVTKKAQQNKDGDKVTPGRASFTVEDKALFEELLDRFIENYKNTDLNKAIFPEKIGNREDELPLELAVLLAEKLQKELGVVYEIQKSGRDHFLIYKETDLEVFSNNTKSKARIAAEKRRKEHEAAIVKKARKRAEMLEREMKRTEEALKASDEGYFSLGKPLTLQQTKDEERAFRSKEKRDRIHDVAFFFKFCLKDAVKLRKDAYSTLIKNAEDTNNKENAAKFRHLMDSVTPLNTVQRVGAESIFKKIKEYFNNEITLSEDKAIQREILEIKTKHAEQIERQGITEKQIKNKAKEIVLKEKAIYKKMVAHFNYLAEKSLAEIAATEYIKINSSTISDRIEQDSEKDIMDFLQDEFSTEEIENIQNDEIVEREGWQMDLSTIATFRTLSQNIKRYISTIQATNSNNRADLDDLGIPRYIHAQKAHAIILSTLRNILNVEDMMKALEEASVTKQWLHLIVEDLRKDPELQTEFFVTYYRDFIKQDIVLSEENKYTTKATNTVEGSRQLFNSWEENIKEGRVLSENSIYNSLGRIDIFKTRALLEKTKALQKRLRGKSIKEIYELLHEDIFMDTLADLSRSVGIDVTKKDLITILSNYKNTVENLQYKTPLEQYISALNTIPFVVNREKHSKEGFLPTKEVFSKYKILSRILEPLSKEEVENSSSISGKNRFSYSPPSYLGNLIKNLKNIYKDDARFNQFIKENYLQYEWFRKGGHVFQGWLKDILEDPKYRDLIDFKRVVESQKKDYKDLTPIEIVLSSLAEFNSDPNLDNNPSDIPFAWYSTPILSDSNSWIFVRGERFINQYKKSYKEVLLEKMTDLFIQEYNRISLVRHRYKMYKLNPRSIAIQGGYDIQSKNGVITDLGGAQFKFLPSLNDNLEEIYNSITELQKDPAALKSKIEYILERDMNIGFRKELDYYDSINLFALNSDASFKEKLNTRTNIKNHIELKLANIKELQKLTELYEDELRDILEEKGFSYDSDVAYISALKDRLISMVDSIQKKKGSKPFLMSEYVELMQTLQESKTQEKDTIIEDLVKTISKDILKEEDLNVNLRLIQKDTEEYPEILDTLENYYWNTRYATSQIIESTVGDLAFYDNIEKLQKRFKSIISATTRLNTNAVYKGERVGRETAKTVYIKDEIKASEELSSIEEIVDAKIEKGELTQAEKTIIMKKYSEMNTTDGQAFRTLESYRRIKIMQGKSSWTEADEIAYNNIMSGKYTETDLNTIWQITKPFVHTNIGVESGTGKKIKVPVNFKNSEFVLLPFTLIDSPIIKKDSKLSAIEKYMRDNDIDVIQYESCVKIGGSLPVDINDCTDFNSVYTRLQKTVGNKNKFTEALHEYPYSDYGIITSTPNHGIDSRIGLGTQIKKHIMSDIPAEATFTIGNTAYTKDELKQLYDELLVANIKDSFDKIKDKYKTNKAVSKLLLEEISKNSRYGEDLRKLCTLNENGEFDIPLYLPIISQQIQSLLFSVIRKHITKQEYSGGGFIQTTNYGTNKDLKIVFEGEGQNKRIKHIECYMPIYKRSLVEALLDKEGKINIYRLPKELREAIGYRIPTEDKYSMVPLFIKGFLPMEEGTAIMLPKEITTISNSDFDVDKQFILFPEFDIRRFDTRKAKKAYNEYLDYAEDTDYKTYGEWFQENKEGYRYEKPLVQKVRYNQTLKPEENSRRARNNMTLDIMKAVLTHADTASKILNPGDYDKVRHTSSIISLLKELKLSEITSIVEQNKDLLPKNTKITKYTTDRKPVEVEMSVYEKLLILPISVVEPLAKKYKKTLDPLAPSSFVRLHERNMVGRSLVSIFAAHAASNSLFQHTGISLKDSDTFYLNGHLIKSLHTSKDFEGGYISRNVAGMLGASVDNGKDPQLFMLNMNLLTASVAASLLRGRASIQEVGLLMTQPIIEEITNKYINNRSSGKSLKDIIENTITEYRKKASSSKKYKELDPSNFKTQFIYVSTLAECISKKANNEMDENYYAAQTYIGALFEKALKVSKDLNLVMSGTKADTGSGSAGANIAALESNIEKVKEANDTLLSSNSTLENTINPELDLIKTDLKEQDLNVETLVESQMAMIQAAYTLGVEQTSELTKRFFPSNTEAFRAQVQNIKKYTKYGRLTDSQKMDIYNNIYTFLITKLPMFSTTTEKTKSGEEVEITAEDKRKFFIHHFPYYLKTLKESEDPEIKEVMENNEFIQALKIRRDYMKEEKVAETVIDMPSAKYLTADQRYAITEDWKDLMSSPNEKIRELAQNLFRYSIYRGGFAFSVESFISMVPSEVLLSIPGMSKILKDIPNTAESELDNFESLYIRNHLYNKDFVKTVQISQPTEMPLEATYKVYGKNLIHNNFEMDLSKYPKFKEAVYSNDTETPIVGIKLKENSFTHYYEVFLDYDLATFSRVQPLGFPHIFLEYSTEDSSKTNSVLDDNFIKEQKEDIVYIRELEESKEEDNIYTNEYYIEKHDLIDNTYNKEGSETYTKEETVKALEEAAKVVTGEDLNLAKEKKEEKEGIDSIPKNDSYKDEDGKPLCKF